jgi:hypothetical protein
LKSQSAYPNVGLNGVGVMNKNDANKNFHCVYLKDCQHAYNLKEIPQGSSTATITVRAPSGQTRLVDAFCVTEYLPGRGWKSHTSISCNALNGKVTRSYNCRHRNYATQSDTCTENGYVRAPFRSQNHYKKVLGHMGWNNFHHYHKRTIHGVYSWRNRAYSHRFWWRRGGGWPMKSYGNSGNQGGFRSWWRSIDNGPWWMTNKHNRNEPNGQYTRNANLRTSWGGVQSWGYSRFSDYWNRGWTGGDYTCGHKYY